LDARSIDDQGTLLAACPIGRRAAGSLLVDDWIRADLAHRAQPTLSIGEDEQLIAKLFECAEVGAAAGVTI